MISPNTWNHIAVTFDGTNYKLFLNGVNIFNTTASAGQTPYPYPVSSIGRLDEYLFNGSINEVRIWTRALSQAEIQHDMNCELTLPQAGLAAYYQFNKVINPCNNTSSLNLPDASGNNRYGTLLNFSLTGSQSNWVSGNVNGNCDPFKENTAPVLSTIGNKSVNELIELRFTASATDNDIPANILTFSLTNPASGNFPTGATINASSGDFSWTPSAAQGPETYRVKVVVSDGTDTDEEEIQISVNEVNSPPSFTKGADETILEDAGAQSIRAWATQISAGPVGESNQMLNFTVSNNNNSLFHSADDRAKRHINLYRRK